MNEEAIIMTDKEVIEANLLVAQFMDWKVQDRCNDIGLTLCKSGDEKLHAEELFYHYSWGWLMPVIEKISRIEFDHEEQETPEGGTETIIHTHYPRTFGMLNNKTGNPMFRFNCAPVFEAETLIAAAWLAVVDFIKNQKAQQQKQ